MRKIESFFKKVLIYSFLGLLVIPIIANANDLKPGIVSAQQNILASNVSGEESTPPLNIAAAGGESSSVTDFSSFVRLILDFIAILIPILVSLALLAFFWGAGVFILKAGDPREIEKRKKVLVWGVIGLFVMASIWGILQFLYSDIFGGAFGIPLLPQ